MEDRTHYENEFYSENTTESEGIVNTNNSYNLNEMCRIIKEIIPGVNEQDLEIIKKTTTESIREFNEYNVANNALHLFFNARHQAKGLVQERKENNKTKRTLIDRLFGR